MDKKLLEELRSKRKDFELQARIVVEVVLLLYLCLRIGAFFAGK